MASCLMMLTRLLMFRGLKVIFDKIFHLFSFLLKSNLLYSGFMRWISKSALASKIPPARNVNASTNL